MFPSGPPKPTQVNLELISMMTFFWCNTSTSVMQRVTGSFCVAGAALQFGCLRWWMKSCLGFRVEGLVARFAFAKFVTVSLRSGVCNGAEEGKNGTCRCRYTGEGRSSGLGFRVCSLCLARKAAPCPPY